MKKILSLFILSLSWFVSPAQTLTLDDCINRALAHNRGLSSAKLKREQTAFDMKSYKANFFPQVNLMALDFYTTAKGHFTMEGGHLPIYKYVESVGQFVPDVTMNPDGSYTFNQYADFPSQTMDWKLKNMFVGGISFMQPIYSGGKITAAYEMSKLGVDMADENIRLSESEVIVKTHEAYYQAVRAKELGDVARSYKTLLDELQKNVEGAFRHGMSTRNDIMKVQVKQNEAELSIQKADNGYRLARMNLCHMVGMPLTEKIEVETAMNETSDSTAATSRLGRKDSISQLSTQERPEHAILANKTELARQKVKLTKSDYLPTVAMGANYIYANGGELAGKKLFDDASASVGIAVKVPLDIFGGTTNKVRAAKAAHQIAQLEQQDFDEQMQLELAQYQNLYDEAQTELRLCESALQQATENMRLSRQQYEVGFEPLSDYLETQALWQRCNADLVEARCQVQLSRMRLLKAAGQLR